MYPTPSEEALYRAVLRGDDSTAEMLFKDVFQLLATNILTQVSDVILKEASQRNQITGTPLDVYDLHDPLLIAIAFSDNPNIVWMFYEAVSNDGPFHLISQPARSETIYHVLGRLNPRKADTIFKELQNLRGIRTPNPNNCSSPHTALTIAKETSKRFNPPDESFVKALVSFLDSWK